MDIGNMSAEELKALRGNIDKAIVDVETRRRNEALAALEKTAAEFGYGLRELVSPSAERKTVPGVLYRDPLDPGSTWSGRGRRPNWIKRALEGGRSLDEMRAR